MQEHRFKSFQRKYIDSHQVRIQIEIHENKVFFKIEKNYMNRVNRKIDMNKWDIYR